MRKIRIIALLLILAGQFVFIQPHSFAQNSARNIEAIVKDKTTIQPLEFASVEQLSSSDSTLVTCITDSNGKFIVPIHPQAHKFRIKYLGYTTLTTSINSINKGTLWMEQDKRYLAEIEVQGYSKQEKPDRDIHIINKDIIAGSPSTQEMLGRLSGVNFNRYDRSISVNGQSNVLLLLDGMEKDQQVIRNIAPERVERVEVIKEPVGKYLSDGYSAIINIITKKNYSGIGVFVSDASFFDLKMKKDKPIWIQNFSNADVSYTYKDLNLYAAVNHFGSDLNMLSTFVRQFDDLKVETKSIDDQQSNYINNTNNLNGTIGGDYYINKKHSVSAEIKLGSNATTDTQNNYISETKNSQLVKETQYRNINISDANSIHSTIAYKGELHNGNQLNIDFRYNRGENASASTYIQSETEAISRIMSITDDYRFNASYTHKFSEKISTDFGYNAVFQNTTSSQSSSLFSRQELRNRLSLYISYRPSDKVNMKLGIMDEIVKQQNNQESSLANLPLPYFNIQYKPNSKINIIGKFHSSPTYIDVSQLQPFETQMDSLRWSIGNPNLSNITHYNTSIAINAMGWLNVEPYLRLSNGNISSYIYKDNNRIMETTVNSDYSRTYGVRINASIPFKNKSWFAQSFIDVFNKEMGYKELHTSRMGVRGYLNAGYYSSKLNLTAMVQYSKFIASDISLQGYSMSNGNDMVMIYLQKGLLQNRLNLSVIYIPPIPENIMIRYRQSKYVTTPYYTQDQNTHLDILKSALMVNLSYRFNAGKTIKGRQIKEINEEVSKSSSGVGAIQ